MTLGKQIAQHRKKLGLTQDALAEKLGVTAQAVSKWENDQSCPDIATLPKLADLFDVSVDELLGREAAPALTGEVFDKDEDDDEPEGVHLSKGGWEFHWDAGRKDSVFFALFILLVGGLTLTAKLLQWNVGFWDILWPCALLILGLRKTVSRFSFFGIGCTLFGGYFLLENLEITKLDLAGDLIFPVLIVIFGLSLLADALRKPKKPGFHFHHNDSSKKKQQFTQKENRFSCSLSFGENKHLITLPKLATGDVDCSFGELKVDLSGCQTVADNCCIDVTCSFGEVVLLVPRCYRVTTDISTAFGAWETNGQPDALPVGTIHVAGNANFGNIRIEYI